MRRSIAILIAFALLTSCDDGGNTANVTAVSRVGSARSAPTPGADAQLAGRSVSEFGSDLFAAVREHAASDANLVVSPLSVAIALAMVEPGAVGPASTALRALLRIDDPHAFHAAMNALEQNLEARQPGLGNADGSPGEVTMNVANAAYLQRGYPFEPAYVEAVSASYGPVLAQVEFDREARAIAEEINRFVATETRDRITDIAPEEGFDPDTVLALVNALYLKASWFEKFDRAATLRRDFTRLDGSKVAVPLMNGHSDTSMRGDGWVGATKGYMGGLRFEVVLPDEGRFEEVAERGSAAFGELSEARSPRAPLAVPRFETRFNVRLPTALRALGLDPLFQAGGLTGMAPDPRLVLDEAIHETFIAFDEDGTEAAAATILTVFPVSRPPGDAVPVVVDRPFLFRIVDQQTSATLFMGQVLDPS